MRYGWVTNAAFTLLLVAGCKGSNVSREHSSDAGRSSQGSVAGASGNADAAGRTRDAGSLDAAARDASRRVDSGRAAADAAGANTRDTGTSDADQDGSSTPSVPPALRAFADDVRRASEQGQTAGGPVNCAAPLPAVKVMSATEAANAVREYVAAMLGVPVSELREEVQACGDATHAACADAFNLYSGSFGGRVPETVYPLAQQLDSGSTSERLTTFTTGQNGSIKVAVLSAEKAGWLIGIAVFGDRANCAPSN